MLVRIVLFLLLLMITIIAIYGDNILIDHYKFIKEQIVAFGVLAPLYYSIFIFIGISIFIPNQALAFTGGLFFGFSQGFFVNYVGCMAAIIINFLIFRYLLPQNIKNIISKYCSGFRIEVKANDWALIIACRLSPIIPNTLVNYWMGLTKIKSSIYVFISTLCVIPYIGIYTYFGTLSERVINHQLYDKQQLLFSIITIPALLASVYYINKRISWKLHSRNERV